MRASTSTAVRLPRVPTRGTAREADRPREAVRAPAVRGRRRVGCNLEMLFENRLLATCCMPCCSPARCWRDCIFFLGKRSACCGRGTGRAGTEKGTAFSQAASDNQPMQAVSFLVPAGQSMETAQWPIPCRTQGHGATPRMASLLTGAQHRSLATLAQLRLRSSLKPLPWAAAITVQMRMPMCKHPAVVSISPMVSSRDVA